MPDQDGSSEDCGCLAIIGIFIIGLALGAIFTPAYGWLAAGLILLLLAIIG